MMNMNSDPETLLNGEERRFSDTVLTGVIMNREINGRHKLSPGHGSQQSGKAEGDFKG